MIPGLPCVIPTECYRNGGSGLPRAVDTVARSVDLARLSTTIITYWILPVRYWMACALAVVLCGGSLGAYATTPPDSLDASRRMVYSGQGGELNVAAPKRSDAGMVIDGVLNEDVWQTAAVLSDFTQYEPIEGISASEATRIRIFYTTDAIYFGIEAFDRTPGQILARLGERDQAPFNDDWVRLMLDTFNDERQAYTFYVNPLGIQADALWLEGLDTDRSVPVDFNPDFIWTSDGQVTADGWTAEVRIPYISLRFREQPVQTWGFNAAREVKRRGFKQSWAPLTQATPSTLAQGGKLVGLEGLQPRRLVELNPVTTARSQGERVEGTFDRGRVQPEVGLNARYGLTRNLVLDATANPDFSQVEADATQLTVNERFALFFPEKRPFFLDGTEIFNTPKDLVYTRRIVDPIGGAKLTGKVGNMQVGYLGAVDKGPAASTRPGGDALFNLLRARRDVGTGSTVGLLYTDRAALDGSAYNRVVGGDARLLFGERYSFTAQAAGSWTAGPDDADESRGARGLRPLVLASLERSGRHVQWNARFEDIHPDMRAGSGFLRRIGDARLFGETRFYHYGDPGASLERAGLFVRGDSYFAHDVFWRAGAPYEAEVELQPSIWLRGDRYLSVILRNGTFRFRPADYAGYAVERADGAVAPFTMPDRLRHMLAAGLLYEMRLTNRASLGGRSFFRELPIYAEASRGLEFQVNGELEVRPTHALLLSLSHTYSHLRRVRTSERFSLANISRGTIQYQFSKALFVRTILQYNLEKRATLRDPVSRQPLVVEGERAEARTRGSFEGQFLVSYEPSPGTIFYAGYSRFMRGAYDYRWARMDLMEDGLFVKLSYLFRL